MSGMGPVGSETPNPSGQAGLRRGQALALMASAAFAGWAAPRAASAGAGRDPAPSWSGGPEDGRLSVGGAPLLDVTANGDDRAVAFPAQWGGGALTFETVLPSAGQGLGPVARLVHHMDRPRHIWLPHLTPNPDNVIGDHALRSPVIVLADAQRAMVLAIDVADIEAARAQGLRVWLDYDNPSRAIRVAVGGYKVGSFHTAYQSRSIDYRGQTARVRLHLLVSEAPDDLRDPYGLASRWLWGRLGHDGFRAGGSQRAPFSTYAGYVVNWAFAPEPAGWGDTVWQSFKIDGREAGAPAFIVDVAQHPSTPLDQRRWREGLSVWNQAWFSTQRAANGLLRYARQTGSADLERRAGLMTRVALLAPQTDGLFPAVFSSGGGWYRLYKDTPSLDQGRWTNSDRRAAATSAESCHILDASFTARMLLEWHDLNPQEDEALSYVRRYAARLVRLQRPDGSIPGWVKADGDPEASLAAGPETAMSATLLLDMARRFPSERGYRAAALKALDYLEQGPVREARWEDFETYYSCSRWGEDAVGQRVARNGVFKSNSFSPFWCAEAFLADYRLTGNRHRLALGRRCLDELSLYQQVWRPSWLPADTHGGFGVMNADAEWNDARQSLFAPLYLDYFAATGEPEYFERGVSALKTSFAMMYAPENARLKPVYEKEHPRFGPESYGFMMENIAHRGPDNVTIGPFAIYTWGSGAALEAYAKIRDRYGDIYVDLKRGQAFGIDGVKATLSGASLLIEDPHGRASLLLRTDGAREVRVRLDGGRARIGLPTLTPI